VRLAGGKITAMEFNAARQKQSHDFGGETARMHEDEILEAARRDHDAARVATETVAILASAELRASSVAPLSASLAQPRSSRQIDRYVIGVRVGQPCRATALGRSTVLQA
jgi:hypothetical protein